MAQLIQASTILNGFPLPKLKKIDKNEGEVVNPLGLSFTWKIKGADTGYAFAVYEMTMAPAAMIPMHIHPFAEYFYVLEGTIDIMGLAADGTIEWTSRSVGDSANAPSNAPHGIKNRSNQPAKFLSTANFQHEESFNQIVAAMDTPVVKAMSEQEQADLFMQMAGDRQVYFLQPNIDRSIGTSS